jgi:hypothetical protein
MRTWCFVLGLLIAGAAVSGAEGTAFRQPGELTRAGEMEVTVERAWIGRPSLKAGEMNVESQHRLLLVAVKMVNRSADRNVMYDTWRGDSGAQAATVRDDRGKTCGPITFPEAEVAGTVRGKVLVCSGQTVTDLLMYECPAEGTQSVRIRLPLRNVRGKGEATYEVPLEK